MEVAAIKFMHCHVNLELPSDVPFPLMFPSCCTAGERSSCWAVSSQGLATVALISKCFNAINSESCVVSYNKGVVPTAGVLGVIYLY